MACGLPVVASDYPGVRAVVDETTGRLVKQGDPEAVAGALRELVAAGPEARRELGEAGRAKALARWSWPRLVERMDDAYEQAMRVRRT
jgi:glycosyltransferase involved in cell wall biosynthesis